MKTVLCMLADHSKGDILLRLNYQLGPHLHSFMKIMLNMFKGCESHHQDFQVNECDIML